MKIAEVKVAKTTCEATQLVPIPKGIVGATVSIEYMDSAWDGLQKTVVFRGAVTKDVLSSGNEVVIPAEVVSRAGRNLYIGVYGVNTENNVVIPTIWTDLGPVNSAAAPSGDASSDPSLPVWAQIQGMIGDLDDLDTNAKNNLVAAVNEAMTKGGGDVDPAEIQQIVEDYLAANPPTVTESDPTVPAWAKQPTKPSYTAAEVGADPAGTAAAAVSQHNTDTTAHNDLRIALQGLSDRINAALDSDDTTMDQMSEVVAYIKSNKSLIDAITTSKVSVADIVNDLVTNVVDKPLSAAQGVVLKKLIDDLQAMIPEGGSGIAVTGATVGQTVKIAAVDENGKPTAFEPVDFPKGGHWETIYEYVSDNIVVTDFSITYDEANKYSILTVPDGVLSEFNVGDNVILAIFPLDGTSAYSDSYLTGSQYDIKKNISAILSDVEIRIPYNNDRSDITPSNAVIEIMHGDIPKIFGDTIAFNPTSKIRYTGINTGGDISGYTYPLFYKLKYEGNRSEGFFGLKTKHMNLIANLEVANGLLLFRHTLSANMLCTTSAFHNKWTDRDVVGYIDAPTSYMTDGKLTSMNLGSSVGTPMFTRKGGFIRIEGWYE